MNTENPIPTERKDWLLTPEDETIVLETARHNKIKKMEWMNKQDGWNSDLSAIQLTDEEKEAALVAGNRIRENKMYFDQIQAENRQRSELKERALLAKWNYAHFFRVMKDEAHKLGEKLEFNENTAPIIKALCFLLSRDERYESELGLSFSKGLIIRGNPGLGKSWLIGLVADNPVSKVQIVTLNEITQKLRTEGENNGLKFASNSFVYLDDVGTEETPVKYYGTELHFFKQLIEDIYAKDKFSLGKVILSTNINFEEMEKKYGFRVRDRLAEMFDVIDIKGKSMRRK